MSFRSKDIPDASDIGLTIRGLRNETLQWQKFSAQKDGVPVSAWRFWPAYLKDGRIDEATWGKMSIGRALQGEKRGGFWPLEQAFSKQSKSGWLIYPKAEQASRASILDQSGWKQIFHDIVTALGHLHEAGSLNLDVHPDNLYRIDDRVRLAGFGFDLRARSDVLSSERPSNRGLARKHFGAPEQWDGSGRSAIGPWTDVFGAAATFHYCLTGIPPADFRIRQKDPDWRSKLAAELQGPLAAFGDKASRVEQLILDGLQPRLDARPRTIAEWASDLPPPPVATARGGSEPTPEDAPDEEAFEEDDVDFEESSDEGSSKGAWIALALAAIGLLGWQLMPDQGADQEQSDDLTNQEALEQVGGTQGAQSEADDEFNVPDFLPATNEGEEEVAEAATDAAEASDSQPADAAESGSVFSQQPPANAAGEPSNASRQDPQANRSFDPPPLPRQSTPTARRTDRSQPVLRPSPRTTPAPRIARIVRNPSWRSGVIRVTDFPTPPGGRQIRYGTSVQVEFTVSPNGRASSCQVTRPGPDARTNARLCELVVSRLRFNPAQDENGNAVSARYAWKQDFFGPR